MAANMQLQIADALRFLDTVKQRFVYNTPAQPHVYSMFLETLAEYKRGEIDRPVVLERVQAMFANEPDLIEGFGQFVANLPDAAQ